MRVAWFTPLPPNRSGIAAYNAELLPHLAANHDMDVFVDAADAANPVATIPVYPSRDFIWRNLQLPYDLCVYQMGNSPAHDYMWAYMVRFPGLLMLHDSQLHNSRARALITTWRHKDYQAEFAFCHPGAKPGAAETIYAEARGSLFYLWPLIRVPMESSRLVAVHGEPVAALLREAYPHVEIRAIEHGVPDPGISSEAGERARARHGIPADRLLFAAFGMLTLQKRLPQILRSLRTVLFHAPTAHLVLVGQPTEHYDAAADAESLGIGDHVTITGYVDDELLPEYLNAADVCLALRWPSARETSGAWLRCLAAAKPTIVTDLVTSTVPSLDPRTWTLMESPGRPVGSDASRARGTAEAVSVAIDVLDEQHSLDLAMRRLASDSRLRQTLGTNARRYWERHYTTSRMAEHYEKVMAEAAGCRVPDRSHFPAHLRTDALSQAGNILADFGLTQQDLGWVD